MNNFDTNRKIELLEFDVGFNINGYLSYCKLCKGDVNVNNELTEPGKQIAKK